MKKNEMAPADDDRLCKKSVVAVYETETFGSLLDDVLHPGGLKLTRRAGGMACIDEGCTVLDIACGKGEGLFLLAAELGCRAVGIDLSRAKIADAAARATRQKISNGISFLVSDAEELPFPDAAFDVVLSECSFSILPCKEKAAWEIARVLKPGGRFVMTDITREEGISGGVSDTTTSDAGFVLPCIAGAGPAAGYIELFRASGLGDAYWEDHANELKKIGYRIVMTFGSWANFLQSLSAELSHASPGKEDLRTLSPVESHRRAFKAVKLGYALIRMTKPR